jgi:hypothetical protein
VCHVTKRAVTPFLLHWGVRACRLVIERSAHDLEFWMLILHRGLYVAMSHSSHHGGKVSASHQNSCPVIMSCAVEDQFFRKASLVTCFPKEITDRPQMS